MNSLLRVSPAKNARIKFQRRGFSLVEILVTMVIVMVLAALALPSLSRGIRASKQTKCLNNLRQLHQALLYYATEHDGQLPLYSGAGPDGMSGSYWHRRLQDYVNNSFTSVPPRTPTFLCPLDATPQSGILSYGMNEKLTGIRMVQASSNPILFCESSWYLLQKTSQIKKNYNNTVNVMLMNGSVQTMSSVPEPADNPLLWNPN